MWTMLRWVLAAIPKTATDYGLHVQHTVDCMCNTLWTACATPPLKVTWRSTQLNVQRWCLAWSTGSNHDNRVCKSRGEHGAKRRDFPNLGSFHYRSQHNTKKSWAGFASCMAAAIVQTGRNVRFSASLPMLYNVGAGKDCAGKIFNDWYYKPWHERSWET